MGASKNYRLIVLVNEKYKMFVPLMSRRSLSYKKMRDLLVIQGHNKYCSIMNKFLDVL
jgi:hypothetical protein